MPLPRKPHHFPSLPLQSSPATPLHVADLFPVPFLHISSLLLSSLSPIHSPGKTTTGLSFLLLSLRRGVMCRPGGPQMCYKEDGCERLILLPRLLRTAVSHHIQLYSCWSSNPGQTCEARALYQSGYNPRPITSSCVNPR